MPDLNDALNLLDTGNWVSIAYVSFDDKRKTAGTICRINRCRLMKAAEKAGAVKVEKDNTASSATDTRRPEHGKHGTRNVILANNQIRKFHIRLLFAINGHKID